MDRFGMTYRRRGVNDPPIKRTQRHPRYKPEELQLFMREVSAGYSFPQAAQRCGLVWVWVRNALHSDDELIGYCLDLSLVAGALIRQGDLPVPDRDDGLYDKYR